MGQTLTNGIYLPDEGERNSYSGLEANWRTLDALILTINGKAAPNVANTWTAAQTFTAGIAGDLTGSVTGNVTGDLTGTASRAIADEDGTSIKTGYGKLAGSQTWSGTNTWSGDSMYAITGYERGVDASTGFIRIADVRDSNNVRIGLLNVEVNADKSYSFKTYTYNTTVTTGFTIDTFEVGCDTQGSAYTKINGKVKSNLTPLTNSTYALGTSTNQWSSVYAQTYYYNGTAWGLDKANVWTQSQTISINLPALTLQDIYGERDKTPGNTRQLGIYFCDKNGATYSFINRQHRATTGTHLLQANIENGTYDYRLQFYLYTDGSSDFVPSNNGIINLGTSTNKWKTLNGINPGALSLPNVNAVTGSSNTQLQDISGDLVQDQYFNCYFTPRMDGWAYIALNCSSATIRSGYSSYTVSVKTARSFANAIYTQSFTKNENAWSNLQIFIPVTANKEITLECTFTGFSVTKAYVIPAQGNV